MSHLYMWALLLAMAFYGGRDVSIWPFVAVAVAILFNLRLWRDVAVHLANNRWLSSDQRNLWEFRLKVFAPVVTPVYVWRYVR